MDTPVFESLKILRAKDAIGEEGDFIYELKEEELGLRYDHTPSLARYYAMHAELPLPFKRYMIGEAAWRMDEPQRNRYREFTQADVDILGGNPVYADAEVIAAAAEDHRGGRHRLLHKDKQQGVHGTAYWTAWASRRSSTSRPAG